MLVRQFIKSSAKIDYFQPDWRPMSPVGGQLFNLFLAKIAKKGQEIIGFQIRVSCYQGL